MNLGQMCPSTRTASVPQRRQNPLGLASALLDISRLPVWQDWSFALYQTQECVRGFGAAMTSPLVNQHQVVRRLPSDQSVSEPTSARMSRRVPAARWDAFANSRDREEALR